MLAGEAPGFLHGISLGWDDIVEILERASVAAPARRRPQRPQAGSLRNWADALDDEDEDFDVDLLLEGWERPGAWPPSSRCCAAAAVA